MPQRQHKHPNPISPSRVGYPSVCALAGSLDQCEADRVVCFNRVRYVNMSGWLRTLGECGDCHLVDMGALRDRDGVRHWRETKAKERIA